MNVKRKRYSRTVGETSGGRNILLVKMSSLGDIVHTFPAITDAIAAQPQLNFCWVVEDAFTQLALCHPGVQRVLPLAWRRWRRHLWQTRAEFLAFRQNLQSEVFDLVLDAQGLLKSAAVSRMANAEVRAGLSWRCAREPLASIAYNKKYEVNNAMHAIHRSRCLFSQALGYPLPERAPDYGLNLDRKEPKETYVLFLHGSTWASKQWPVAYWRRLAEFAAKEKKQVHIPFGSALERERAETIAKGLANCRVLPPMNMADLIKEIQAAWGVVSVDSGLGHVAAAFGVPVLGLYGSTDPHLTGLVGERSLTLQSSFDCSACLKRKCPIKTGIPIIRSSDKNSSPPCVAELTPDRVWRHFSAAG